MRTHTHLTTLNPVPPPSQMCPGLLCPVQWQVKWSSRFCTRATSFSLWWCTSEAWWVSAINHMHIMHIEMLSWYSPMRFELFFSNLCRREQILIHTSNCTSSQTLRKLAKERPRQPGEHATPLTMRWWENITIRWYIECNSWAPEVKIIHFLHKGNYF